MARALVIGNGRLLINFDSALNMRDLYFPHVGQLNHIGGHHNSFGVWVDDQFSWCYEADWHRILKYKKETLVTDVKAINHRLGLQILINDAVHYRDCIYIKKMVIKNLAEREREIRVFFNHDFSIDESEVGDTAVYNPGVDAVYHYKKNNYFLANGRVR
ncbi:MAG: glycoside hydrolase family 15, partial [Firmicutes bacterium HGW-Firmicutes-13]